MKRRFAILLSGITLAIVMQSVSLAQTLARLSHEATPDVPHTGSVSSNQARLSHLGSSAGLSDSAFSRAAARALFVDSKLDRGRLLAERALKRNSQDAEALFVRMEVAAMEADEAVMLDAAVRLCEVGARAPGDPRVLLAAGRVRESAANTPEFRQAVPRLRALLANSQETLTDLHEALLAAAMDGVPGLDPYAVSRDAGILTDWRIVGPLSLHSLLDEQPAFHSDDLAQASYDNRLVENFQFPDGKIVLPDYLSRRGLYYGASGFASLTAARWTVRLDGAGALEVSVDGQPVLRTNARGRSSANFEVAAGPHRVLVKLAGTAAPLRVAISETTEQAIYPNLAKDRAERGALPQSLSQNISLQEFTYLLAAQDYARGDYATAIKQIAGVPSVSGSAALEFLLAQSEMRRSPTPWDSDITWDKLRALSPNALSADVALAERAFATHDLPVAFELAKHVLAVRPSNRTALEILTDGWTPDVSPPLTLADESALWTRRILADPSCETSQRALAFYRVAGRPGEAGSAQQTLNGCAPESLEYAQSLSAGGNHAAAARALEVLLAASPLNRAAREMLVVELQLSGDDEAAQRAAAEWLHIAPNAQNFHRLAADAPDADGSAENASKSEEFYAPYRRDAALIARQDAALTQAGDAEVLLDDHVAIARADGSVSLYVHTATCLLSDEAASRFGEPRLPQGVQVLAFRIVHTDGTVTAIDVSPQSSGEAALIRGDIVDEEYVLHYAGDGGIALHTEAFQFVFGSFNQQVLHSRFVVLMPAGRADRGAVITTGKAPQMTGKLRNGMLERVWEEDAKTVMSGATLAGSGPAIVRVVEQENGWSQPSSAEHRRRIETIHPGPRPEDS